MIDHTPPFAPSPLGSHAPSPRESDPDTALALMLEGLGDGVWDWDMVTGQAYFSPSMLAIYGPLAHATDLDALAHPDDLPALLAGREAHWRGDTPAHRSEHRARHCQGHWIWVLARSLVTSRDPQGQPLRMVGTHADITTAKLAEFAHVQLGDQLARAAHASRDGWWDWDLLTDKVHGSPHFQQLLGHETPADFDANFSLRSHLHPDDRAPVSAAIRAQIKGLGDRFDVEFRLRTRQGVYRWFHARGQTSDPDAQGKPTRFAGHLTDVHHRVAAELDRRQLEKQVREGQKLETLGKLTGGVAQDFDLLLSAMLGRLRLASEELGPQSPVLPHLQAVAQGAERAQSLVQQVLAFSRQQTQRMKVQDLGPLVADVLAQLKPLVPPTVTLTSLYPNAPLWVVADAQQLKQVVTHLCTNAWQSMDGGVGDVTVAVAPGAHGGATLVVQDSGPGMSSEVVARVFEPFFSTKAQTSGGRGLGLAAVYGIVKTHQGSIGVQSAPGKGSRFEVWLPAVNPQAQPGQQAGLVPEPSAATLSPADEPAMVAPPPDTLVPMHVVYIDDYEAMVYLISRMLKKHGIRVSAFERAADALALIQANPDGVDLLVTDYNMPGMSGLDVVRQVKKWAPSLPVVITSGHVTPGMTAEAQSVGVLKVLNKQDSVEELAARIAKLVQRLPSKPGTGGPDTVTGAGAALSGKFPG